MPHPFMTRLNKKHNLPRVTSYDASQSLYAAELQHYVDAGHTSQYRKRVAELKELDIDFRLTDNIVYETRYEGQTVDVTIMVQVKGHSITWYFWAPGALDEYPQEFRNLLYNAAGECHAKVDNGCDLYYRGSNAFHVKTMHHLELEAQHNHNHYRMKDNASVTPKDFNQHMLAFKDHQVHDTFFEEGEIERLCEEFSRFYEKWTAINEGELSLEEQYKTQQDQVLNEADKIEFMMYGAVQEPCRISVEELKVDFEKVRSEIEGMLKGTGNVDIETITTRYKQITSEFEELLSYRESAKSVGLRSDLRNTRQIEGSVLPTLPASIDQIDAKPIPQWATHAHSQINTAMTRVIDEMEKYRQLREQRLLEESKPGREASIAEDKVQPVEKRSSQYKGSFLNELNKQNREESVIRQENTFSW